MKPLLPLLALIGALGAQAAPQAPDSTGLPGDQFSLRGALDAFKRSKDLTEFEQALNTSDNQVNNLDLDSNGEVDYIHVRTHADGDARVIVLQAAFGKEDVQDVAAIELERTGDGQAVVQIRGDELLYPEATIIEPAEEVKEGGRKGGGPSAPDAQITVWVNVWGWPSVQWCYGPYWYDWASPWYWGYYPPWWRPWRPWGWSVWWGFPRPYWGWYHHVHYCRVERAHNVYMHRRSVSSTVSKRPDVVRRPAAPGQPDGKDRGVRPVEMERGKQPETKPQRVPETKPNRVPETKPDRKPTRQPQVNPERKPRERVAPPQKQPQRTQPAPQRNPPQKAPGRPPGGRR
ncbi:MAG: hypothetical protein QY325_10760 [Flavobacteriales bacterium]|jgi:hypothetical protein|nr:MAG: hypothetical protein QY325_10760 [Flavobacteriales bacterium]